MTVKHDLRRLLWTVGYDVERFDPGSHPIARRRRLLASQGVEVVLDVGANEGQWGEELRRDLQFRGRICSFEPMSAAFGRLQDRAARDPLWEVFQLALGDATGSATLNIAGNSYSSSIFEMLPMHAAVAPESKYVGTEEIAVTTLDDVFEDLGVVGARVFLKIDTQGYEGRVLRGATRSLAAIDLVQLEMPLAGLYEGELSFLELLKLMEEEGYSLIGLEPGFNDPRTGRLLQVDGVFRRSH